jgi:hypothetical protein
VSFAAIILCVASQRVFIIVVVYCVSDSARKLLDTSSDAVNTREQWRAAKNAFRNLSTIVR